MGGQSLLKIERNHIYDLTDFSAIQRSHLDSVKESLAAQHAVVMYLMADLWTDFKDGTISGEV